MRHPCLLSFLAALAACSVDTLVPGDAAITCSTDADCPSDLSCNLILGRCTGAQTDFEAPQVESAVLGPQIIREGQLATLLLAVSEPLLAPPVVRLDSGGSFVLAGAFDTSATTFSLEYTAAGTEPEAALVPEAELLDAAGNRNVVTLDVSLGFDFTAPAVVDAASVAYIPAPGSLSAVGVTAARTGSTVEITLEITEPLGGVPTLTSLDAPDWIFEPLSAPANLHQRFAAIWSDTLGEERTLTSFQLAVVDVVGNPAVLTPTFAPPIRIDTLEPPPADVDTVDRLIYHRAPHGSIDGAASPTFSLEATAGAATPGEILVVFDGADPSTADELARAVVNDDGSTPSLSLPPQDRAAVYVSVIDHAGNMSPGGALRVRDVRWTVSLADGAPDNPHQVLATSAFSFQRDQPDRQPIDSSLVGQSDGITATSRGGGVWFHHELTDQPLPPTESAAMTTDVRRGRAVLFGGLSNFGELSETWEWDGRRWQLVTPIDPEGDGAPGPTYGHLLAYDARRGVTVLFGGHGSGSIVRDELWEYDGLSWTERCDGAPSSDTCATRPGAVYDVRGAYDARRGVTVVFGGRDGGGTSTNALWEWDGTGWQERCDGVPASDSCATEPAARYQHAMAYYPKQEATLLFGGGGTGCDEVGGVCGDFWAWDGVAWSEIDPGVLPPERIAGVMVYDPAEDDVGIYAGNTGGSDCEGTLGVQVNCVNHATWDGVEWTLTSHGGSIIVSPVVNYPFGRRNPAATSDPLRGGKIIVGGYEYGPATRVAIGWRRGLVSTTISAAWSVLLGSAGEAERPSARSGHAMAAWFKNLGYLPTLFGGRCGDPPAACQDTWRWRFGWNRLCSGGGDPAAGCSNSPTARYDAAIVPLNGLNTGDNFVALFGGRAASLASTSTQLVIPNGDSWQTPVNPAGPPSARSGHTMTADPRNNVAWSFGGLAASNCDGSGQIFCSSIWELSLAANTWTRRCTSSGICPEQPAPRSHAAFVFDTSRRRAVMFGGEVTAGSCPTGSVSDGAGSCRFGDTWEWTGERWFAITPTDPEDDGNPAPRSRAAGYFDMARKRVVVHGGTAADPNVWEWDGVSWTQVPLAASAGLHPVDRQSHSFVSDFYSGGGLLFGGQAAARLLGDTWVWQIDSGSVPGHMLRVDYSLAQGPSAGACLTPGLCAIRAVEGRWRGTAYGGVVNVELCALGNCGTSITENKYFRLLATRDARRAWRLHVRDTAATGTGTFDSWCVQPTSAASPTCQNVGAAITDYGELTSTIDLTGTGPADFEDVDFTVNLTHGAPSQLVVSIDALPLEGTRLGVYDNGVWRDLSTRAGPGPLEVSITDPSRIGRLIDADGTLLFAARPAAPNHQSLAELETDAFEATVVYRLP